MYPAVADKQYFYHQIQLLIYLGFTLIYLGFRLIYRLSGFSAYLGMFLPSNGLNIG